MREKRHRITPLPDKKIERKIEEICIAKNRTVMPFVLSFSYEAENIALSPLGNLSGVFSISEHESDSAYIGNCLAAVIKKEYFANPKKNTGDAFEASLHKTNLTLAKLVQEGHVSWIGKLHGAIIAIQKDEIHFSISGNGAALLCRNDICSEISEGMSSEESSENPLKTFTDISSGTLLPGDKVLLSTPELLGLLSPLEIGKQAKKLDRERFAQFIKTALINTYSQAGVIIIDIVESSSDSKESPLRYAEETNLPATLLDESESASYIENIFSEQTFRKKTSRRKQAKNPPKEPKEKPLSVPGERERDSEHIDTRTGHIYLRGEDFHRDTNTSPSVFSETLSDISDRLFRFFESFGRITLRLSRSLGKTSLEFGKKIYTQGKCLFQSTIRAFRKSISHTPSSQIQNLRFRENVFDEKPPSSTPESSEATRLKRIVVTLQKSLTRLPTFRTRFIRKGALQLVRFFRNTQRSRLVVVASAITTLLLLIFIVWFFFNRKNTETIPPIKTTPEKVAPVSSSVLPPADEPNAQQISELELFSADDSTSSPTLPILLNNKLFAITENVLVNTENKLSLQIPESAAPILRATAMNDLNAIFLYGSDKKMYLYYPNAKSFIENTFSLPDNFSPDDMGTYLTYLYVFDRKQGRILRFPRAEGGFGIPNEWLKEKMSFSENAQISIGENILIGSENTIFSFSKGRGAPLSLSEIKTPIAIQDIAIVEDSSFAALDAKNKRIVRFGKDGQLLGQYYSERLGEARSIAVSSNGTAVYAAVGSKIFLFEIQ